jgi:hypothetical protein
VVAGTKGERRARGPGGLDEGAIGYSSVPLNKAKAKQGLESETLVNVQHVCYSGEPGSFCKWIRFEPSLVAVLVLKLPGSPEECVSGGG